MITYDNVQQYCLEPLSLKYDNFIWISVDKGNFRRWCGNIEETGSNAERDLFNVTTIC